MILNVFSVYDQAAQAYLPPFFTRSKGEALRSFTEACNDPKSNFAKYSADFYLVFLGEYDDSSGMFSCSNPARVISAVEVAIDNPFTEETELQPKAANGSKRLPM